MDAQRALLDPEPRPDLALQRREPLPAVLLPGRRRRRPGDERPAASRGRRTLDPADVADAEADARTRTGRWARSSSGSALYYRLTRDRTFVAEVDARCSAGTSPSSAASSPRASAGSCSASASRPTSPTRSTASTRRRSSGRACAGWAIVWAETGDAALAATCRRLADRARSRAARGGARIAGAACRTARSSSPSRLLDRERPYEIVIESRAGSYWNLVVAVRARLRPLRARKRRGGGRPALPAPPRLALPRARPRRRLRALRADRAVSRPRARTRSTGSTSRGSSPTTTSRSSSCSASTASWRRQ